MRVNSVSDYSHANRSTMRQQNPAFGNAFVTLSKANLGEVIARNVDSYNGGDFRRMYAATREIAQGVIDKVGKVFEGSEARIKTVKDLTSKVDAFVLAGGSGSRFKPLAAKVAELKNNGGVYNKISVPFELGQGEQPLTMLDIPMAMMRFFGGKKGYGKIIAENPTGSFGDVIAHYLHTGRKPKDVVVCCGDNVFDAKGEEMLEFLVRTINNPQKQLGVVGVARTPNEVANRFGVLKVGARNPETGLYSLEGFVEKPALDAAKKLVTEDGNNVANTGMFVIKKESMANLLKTIRQEKKIWGGKTLYIAKDPNKEIYDFAAATKKVQGMSGSAASDVKIVKTWEDVGEPYAYLRWLNDIKDNHYLANVSPERRKAVLDAVSKRVTQDSIKFSLDSKGEALIDGIKIQA